MNKKLRFSSSLLLQGLGPKWALNWQMKAQIDSTNSSNLTCRPKLGRFHEYYSRVLEIDGNRACGPKMGIFGPGNGWRRVQIDLSHLPNCAWRSKLGRFQEYNNRVLEIYSSRAFGPKMGIVWARECGKKGPNQLDLFIHSCSESKIMGIQWIKR